MISSNEFLRKSIQEDGDDEDGELAKAVEENEEVIRRMRERIEMVDLEVERRKSTGTCETEIGADEEAGKGPGLVRLNGQDQAHDVEMHDDSSDEGVHL